jgi:Tfp pilus assembly protein PilX
MQVILAQLRRRLADESGMTMVVVMGVLLVATLFSVAALAAADGDISQSRSDIDRKQAYAAAEAGINDYMSRLNQDSNYWTNCANVPAPAPVNQRFVRTSTAQADPRKWRKLPNSTEAEYTIELIPANGASACDSSNPAGTMIDTGTGSFKIRATGRSSPQGTGTPVYRSITAKFRRKGFLDFLWFTDLETSDPEYFRSNTTQYNAALTECLKYERNGRPSGYPCSDITFIGGDGVRGPLHTNDRLLVAGSPVFGRTSNDEIETVAKDGKPHPEGPAWEPNGAGSPNFVGKLVSGAPMMQMPPTNAQLSQLASWTFTGDTQLLFNNSSVTIKTFDQSSGNLITETRSLTDPDFNGVIYVKAGACNNPSTRQNEYPLGITPGNPLVPPRDKGCANLWVSGPYSRSVTLASAGDVIVKADEDTGTGTSGKGVRRNGDVIMGLIADNFVRVYHPCTSDTNRTGTEQNVQIDAAILSLNHSFTVDDYACGAQLGTLTVNGAIAQKFRGPVGSFGSTPHGYTKNYNYDDRLLYRSPPYFLDPVQSAWRTVSYTEESKPNK